MRLTWWKNSKIIIFKLFINKPSFYSSKSILKFNEMKSYYHMSYGYISRCHVTHDDIKILMICVYKLLFDITVWQTWRSNSLKIQFFSDFQQITWIILTECFMNGFSLINFRFAKETTKMEKIEPYIWFHALFIGSGSTPRDRHFFVQTNSPQKRFRFFSRRIHSQGPKSRKFYLFIGYLVAIFIFGKSSRRFPSTLTGNDSW